MADPKTYIGTGIPLIRPEDDIHMMIPKERPATGPTRGSRPKISTAATGVREFTDNDAQYAIIIGLQRDIEDKKPIDPARIREAQTMLIEHGFNLKHGPNGKIDAPFLKALERAAYPWQEYHKTDNVTFDARASGPPASHPASSLPKPGGH